MRIYKTRAFDKWAAKEGLADPALATAVAEMEAGLIDAELGACRAWRVVARQMKNRGQFFDLLRRIVVLFNDKERKNGPIFHRRSRFFPSLTGSLVAK